MDENHPKCSNCESDEFTYDRIHRAGSNVFLFIVYCTACGHIVGCAAPNS